MRCELLIVCFLVAVLLISTFSCKRGPTEPVMKDPSEYVWTADTLDADMWAMWGTSSTNVYMVGFSNAIVRYDGQSWKSVPMAVGPGSPITHLGDYFGIYGFGPNDVLAVGGWGGFGMDSSLIIHYDGYRWVEQSAPGGRELLTVWGSGSHDVWVGGHAGSLFHYDGVKWAKVPIDSNLDIKDIKGLASDDVYFLGTRIIDQVDYTRNYRVIFHYDGTVWTAIDSMQISVFSTGFGDARLGTIGRTLYSVGYDGIYARRDGKWQKELYVPPGGLSCLYASSASNAFTVGIAMYHFDGQAWRQVENTSFEGATLSSVWCTDYAVFSMGEVSVPIKTLIVHGR